MYVLFSTAPAILSLLQKHYVTVHAFPGDQVRTAAMKGGNVTVTPPKPVYLMQENLVRVTIEDYLFRDKDKMMSPYINTTIILHVLFKYFS